MVKAEKGAAQIEVDVYDLPLESVGAFMQQVKPPLSIGTVHLADGRYVKGFLCEECAAADAEDITKLGTYTIEA